MPTKQVLIVAALLSLLQPVLHTMEGTPPLEAPPLFEAQPPMESPWEKIPLDCLIHVIGPFALRITKAEVEEESPQWTANEQLAWMVQAGMQVRKICDGKETNDLKFQNAITKIEKALIIAIKTRQLAIFNYLIKRFRHLEYDMTWPFSHAVAMGDKESVLYMIKRLKHFISNQVLDKAMIFTLLANGPEVLEIIIIHFKAETLNFRDAPGEAIPLRFPILDEVSLMAAKNGIDLWFQKLHRLICKDIIPRSFISRYLGKHLLEEAEQNEHSKAAQTIREIGETLGIDFDSYTLEEINQEEFRKLFAETRLLRARRSRCHHCCYCFLTVITCGLIRCCCHI